MKINIIIIIIDIVKSIIAGCTAGLVVNHFFKKREKESKKEEYLHEYILFRSIIISILNTADYTRDPTKAIRYSSITMLENIYNHIKESSLIIWEKYLDDYFDEIGKLRYIRKLYINFIGKANRLEMIITSKLNDYFITSLPKGGNQDNINKIYFTSRIYSDEKESIKYLKKLGYKDEADIKEVKKTYKMLMKDEEIKELSKELKETEDFLIKKVEEFKKIVKDNK